MKSIRTALYVVLTFGTATTISACNLGELPTTYDISGDLVETADMDRDGFLDIITFNKADDEYGLLSGADGGQFSPSTHRLFDPNTYYCQVEHSDWEPDRNYEEEGSCTFTGKLASVDANKDSNLDLIAEMSVSYYYADEFGSSSYEGLYYILYTANSSQVPSNPAIIHSRDAETIVPDLQTSLTVADVTNDGIEDIIITDPITVLPGTGTGTFDDPVTSESSAVLSPTVDAEDLDSDGSMDLLVSGFCLGGSGEEQITGCIRVFSGDSTGEFVENDLHRATDAHVDLMRATLGDINGDGDVDIVTGNSGTDFDGGGPVGSLSIFYGHGDGTFDEEVSISAPERTQTVQLADFDGDSHLDLLTARSHPNDTLGRILFGDGMGDFSELHLLPTGVGLVADLNSDNKPDFIARNSESVFVFINVWESRPEDPV